MRYIPLNATERGYIGSHWNAKYLRALQCMMIPTQGKGVGSVSFFEADFGASPDEFVENMTMPETLMRMRGHFVERKDEAPEEREKRLAEWQYNNTRINEWRRLYHQLGEDKAYFDSCVADNVFLPEKILSMTNTLCQKLYLYYLTSTRLFKLFEMLDPKSPTSRAIHAYICEEAPVFYTSIIKQMVSEATQLPTQIKSFYHFFGDTGLKDLLNELVKDDFSRDDLLKTWAKAYDKDGTGIDFTLVRLYRRYIELGCLSSVEHSSAQQAILSLNIDFLRKILTDAFESFKSAVREKTEHDAGKVLISEVEEKLFTKLQISFFELLEEKYDN